MSESKLHPEVKKYLSERGRIAGRAGKGKSKARTSEQARKAVMARWAKVKKIAAGD